MDYITLINSNLENLVKIVENYNIKIKQMKKGYYQGNCPFHNDKTPSFGLYEKNEKARFKCQSCGAKGDAIDFIQKYTGLGKNEAIKEACQILGIENDDQPSKIKKFINFIKNNSKLTGYNYENTYIYYNADGNPIFLKNKYRSIEDLTKKTFITKGIKETENGYRYLKNELGEEFDKIEKYIYNYPRIKKAIENGKDIYIVEGEKDADNLNKLGLAATTIYSKHWDDNYTNQLQGADIVFIGDTGRAGEEFKNIIWNNLKNNVKSFKIVKLPNIEELGDNKDVTDWIESGHNKSELLNIVKNRTLDLLNEFELQQDHNGIYKIFTKEVKNNDEIEIQKNKVYFTNFKVISAEIIRNQDTKDQIINLKIENNLGYSTTIEANARDIFTDVRTFKKCLGIDFIFTGKINILTQLHAWIIKYFVTSDIKNYSVTGIRKINNEYVLVTNNGILHRNGVFDTTIKAINPYHNIDFSNIEVLSKEEAEKLSKYLFNFNSRTNIFNTLGLGIAYMLNTFVRESTKDNLPVLQDIGESNSGKSKAFDILKYLYNNTNTAMDFTHITQFSLQKALSDTYLPIFIDELKPSKAPNKINILSGFIRGVTEGYTTFKGTKNQTVNSYTINGTLLVSGEEELQETAIKNRSNIVWYSQSNFTKEGKEAIEFLCQTDEGQLLLRRLSKSLYLHVLNNYSKEILEKEYNNLKEKYEFNTLIESSRECNTAIYTMLGFKLLTDTLKDLGVNIDESLLKEAAISIAENISENVLEGSESGGKAEYEIMLETIDHLVKIDDEKLKITSGIEFKEEDDFIALRVKEIWDKVERYYKLYKNEKLPINRNTFTKTLRKSKYFLDYNKVSFKESFIATDGTKHFKNKQFKAYKLKKDYLLKNLDINNLIEVEPVKKETGKIINL